VHDNRPDPPQGLELDRDRLANAVALRAFDPGRAGRCVEQIGRAVLMANRKQAGVATYGV
jgi:hypothetical protein